MFIFKLAKYEDYSIISKAIFIWHEFYVFDHKNAINSNTKVLSIRSYFLFHLVRL